MNTSQTPSVTCTASGKAAASICTGCAGDKNITDFILTPTWYCGKACQTAHWATHMKSCQAVQAKVKLFRAVVLLQQVFLATLAEAFDLSLAGVERAQDGKIHIFDQPSDDLLRPMSTTLTNSAETKNAVMSYSAGGDMFFGIMLKLCVKALTGFVTKCEGVDVRVFDSRVAMYHHPFHNLHAGIFDTTHSVLRVTLKDKSTWAVDVAGAQFGQCRSVMPFADYSQNYIAKVLAVRPFGQSAASRPSFRKRHPGNKILDLVSIETQSYQVDELVEWEYHNLLVHGSIKAKSDDFERFKQGLTDHLAEAAREYAKLSLQDPTSKAKLIMITDHGVENMSESDKGTMERKKAWIMAEMTPASRQMWEERMASGYGYIMI